MGADLITVSYTTRSKEPEVEEGRAIVLAHLEAVRSNLDKIDGGDYLDARDLDEDGRNDEGEDGLLRILLDGYAAHAENWRYQTTYTIPRARKEDEALYFVLAGGTSYGDDPFDGFSDLCFLIQAVEQVPSLGENLGILGGGIVIPGRAVY